MYTLDVGCGAGLVARLIQNDYIGIDSSGSLVSKLISCTGKTAIRAVANNIPFKDQSFDFVICIGVFQYFPDKKYAQEVIHEMQRVARLGVYIGSVRHTTHTTKKENHIYSGQISHLCYTLDDFPSFTQTETNYSSAEYFDVYKML